MLSKKKHYEYDANENLGKKLYEYSNICHTLPGYEFDANEYLNILFSKNYKIIWKYLDKNITNICIWNYMDILEYLSYSNLN